ncbi:MAG TPA: HEPN domain-containing protein [Gemmatimonadales bacterium]|nr:HEPN domain-containing protein [Gemmatimonadales bacterium]
MPNRAHDWLNQARRDLDLAKHAVAGGFHEWACFAAQQAAEKAVKATVSVLGGEARGHAIVAIASALPKSAQLAADLTDAARRLDRHYVPTRDPTGFDRGTPHEYYTAQDSSTAIKDAEAILKFCTRHVS